MMRFCIAVLAGTAAAVPALFTVAQTGSQTKFYPGIWLTTTEADVTIAAAIQSSETGDCAAATKQWKGALKTVGDSLPPAYAPGKDIYESLDVVSLMSLYTPKDGVAVACTVIQCPQKSPSADGSTSGDSNTNTEPSKPQVPTEPPADGSGGGSSGGNGEGGEEDLEKEKGKGDVSKLQQAEGSAPVTASAVTAGAGGGAAVPSPPPAAARGGVRGGMTIRRLEEVETGTQGEPFNALVCLFTPKTLTKGTAPFQEGEWKKVLENGTSFSSSSPFLLAAALLLGLLLH